MALSASDYTAILSVLVALGALVISTISLKVNKRTAIEQRASELVRLYLVTGLQLEKKGETKTNFQLFLVLFMANEVLNAYPNDRGWRTIMKDQLEYYGDTLRAWLDENPDYVSVWGVNVEELVREAVDDRQKK